MTQFQMLKQRIQTQAVQATPGTLDLLCVFRLLARVIAVQEIVYNLYYLRFADEFIVVLVGGASTAAFNAIVVMIDGIAVFGIAIGKALIYECAIFTQLFDIDAGRYFHGSPNYSKLKRWKLIENIEFHC